MIVIGIGTGRSGSQSLAYFLNIQESALVMHEMNPHAISWEDSKKVVLENINEFKQTLKTGNPQLSITHQSANKHVLKKIKKLCSISLVGDIAFYYLRYTKIILNENADIKFLCIKRDKEATVKSYLKWSSNRTTKGPLKLIRKRPNRNHWIEHDGTKWVKDAIWDKCYPKYDVQSKTEALRMFWEDYYEQASELEKTYPSNLKIFPIEYLNRKEGQIKILSFLEIPTNKMVLNVGVTKNWQTY